MLRFAKLVGVDEAAVRKAIRNGRLELSVERDAKGRPRIADVALAKREWEANRDPAKVRGPERTPEGATRSGGGAETIASEKRRLTRAQARKADLQVQKLAGQLVEAAVVKREQFEAMRIVRDNVLNVPDRVAGEFAAESNAGRIRARLDAELRQALGAAADALANV